MHESHLSRVAEIFEAAIELPPEHRGALLEARCGGSAALRGQVESLLAAHDESTGFLTPLDSGLEDTAPTGALDVGTLVGTHRLTRELGRGGMGTVYLATRADGAFAHQVAIKVTRATVANRDLARRFEAERQILASLRHPHIVTLIDGGTTPSGHAYLAMEYVDGEPITAWVRQRRCPLEQRLRMFRQVCSAVHAAHQNGIVHRDLKPANILVDTAGLPKVLDFGIAKLIETQGDAGDTREGLLPAPLTPNYASPEQLRGLPVTTACDVYALGVLLYELVAGVRPYETTGKSVDEVLRTVLDEPARRRPSAAAAAADLPYPAARLRGDVDAIVAQAMHVEPGRRYASAEELSADVARFLGGKPIVARDPALGYVLRKLARQHQAAVTVALASLLLVFAALGVALWQRQVALRQEALAEARFADVRHLANALIFRIHDEVAKVQGSTEARKLIVSEALTYLDNLARSSDDESLQVEVARGYTQVARAQGVPQAANLGDRPGAVASLERSIALLTPLLGSPVVGPAASFEALHAYRQLAMVHGVVGDREAALAASHAALALAQRWVARAPVDVGARRALGSTHFSVAQALHPAEAAVPHWEEAGRLFEALLAEQPDDADRMRNVALVHKYMGSLLQQQQKHAEAAERYRRALALDQRRLAANPDNRTAQFDVAIDLANVANTLMQDRQLAHAVELYERSIAMRERLVAADEKDVLARVTLGRVYAATALAHLTAGSGRRALYRAERARALLEPHVASSPDREPRRHLALALFVQGTAADRAGRREQACEDWRRSQTLIAQVDDLSLDPGGSEWIAELGKGVAICRGGTRSAGSR
jgi:non-specific serine/threonine protein kinase/serine/threonine-protein kinase